MCRACRFTKCIAVGMRKSAVQRHRELFASQETSSESSSNPRISPTLSWPMDISPQSYEETGMPTLSQLNENYNQMSTVRRVIHNTGGDNIFHRREPKAVAYTDAHNVHLKEIGLVADWIIKSYPDFEQLHQEQKKLLYRNFFLPFMILECGYMCCLNNRTDILFLPSGDYIDCNRPETFYGHRIKSHLISPNEAVRMFGPSFEIYRRNVLDPMRRENVDNFEFFTLCSLVLWDHGLEGQTEECVQMARCNRERILREVLYYYRRVKQISDPSMRLANLLVLLPALQRSVRRFQEDVEITHVFNVYSVEETFYELVSGRLSDSFFQTTQLTTSVEEEKVIKTEEIDSVWDLNKGQLVEMYEFPTPPLHTPTEMDPSTTQL
ncbi:Nuclear hormone receptor family member nhr-28 [Caenorhabditis elegans]|nr:Nuclear hormone receptor family member nhr-28 [Caenorhabditis elegans]CAI46566.1 Nuclear hormone receptor family member nhr-28 [Caenorhabditis elegans]|eukprot:NP_001024389.1 Nuclear hormone receptor family member nhr-28 [Caenorhabditis elegans]